MKMRVTVMLVALAVVGVILLLQSPQESAPDRSPQIPVEPIPVIPTIVAKAISDFDMQKQAAGRLYELSRQDVIQTQRSTIADLRRDAEAIANRRISLKAFADAAHDKIDGGERAERYIVGDEARISLAKARNSYARQVENFAYELKTPRMNVKAAADIVRQDVKYWPLLRRRILSSIAQILKDRVPRVARTAAEGVALKQAKKVPALAFDGPLPIVDAVMTGWGLYDLAQSTSDLKLQVTQEIAAKVIEQLQSAANVQAFNAMNQMNAIAKAASEERCGKLVAIAKQNGFAPSRSEIARRCLN